MILTTLPYMGDTTIIYAWQQGKDSKMDKNFIWNLDGEYWDSMLESLFDNGMFPEHDTIYFICMG